jgi:hypothetical protein
MPSLNICGIGDNSVKEASQMCGANRSGRFRNVLYDTWIAVRRKPGRTFTIDISDAVDVKLQVSEVVYETSFNGTETMFDALECPLPAKIGRQGEVIVCCDFCSI